MKIRTTLFRLFIVLTVFVTGHVSSLAKDEFELGYDYLYSSAHRVKVRKVVACTKNDQQLWNGAQVRIVNGVTYIYKDNVCITQGFQVWLEHTGNYSVMGDDGEMILVDANGKPTGVHGEELVVLWNGVICALQDGIYCLYTSDGQRLGSIYSDEVIEIYHNGYYCYHLGAYYLLATPLGENVNNAHSDTKPELMDNGLWRCKQNGHVYLINKNGRVHH